jgi:hypothetical protein
MLKAAGFKKLRHAFNRVAEPGLVHGVSFPKHREWVLDLAARLGFEPNDLA